MASVPVEVTDSVPSPEDDEDEEGDKHDEEDEAAGGDEEEEEEEILDGSRNMDGSTKSFICTHPGCGKVFQKNCNLIQHTRVHTGPSDSSSSFCLIGLPSLFESRRHVNATCFSFQNPTLCHFRRKTVYV